MKLLKNAILLFVFIFSGFSVLSQTGQLVGSWQLVKQGNCMDETEVDDKDEDLEDMRKQMQTRTPATAQVVSFNKNSSGAESSRILNMAKPANSKKFYYKFNGTMLLILDKKSQTISDSYLVDKFTSDSLIVSHAARPCETRIFVKIKED